MDHPPAQVFLRPIGSPLTIGMSGWAVASLLQSGLDLRRIPDTQATDVGLILLAAPFVLQLLAAVFSHLARDGAGGAALGVLATTWAAMGLVHISSLPGSRSGALGLLLLAAAAVLALSTIAVAAGKPLPGLVFAAAALRFTLAGVYELGAGGFWRDSAGVIGLVVLGLAGYCILAFELEGQRRKPVLPTFRRGRAALATSDGVVAQVDGVAHEAGVRQTT
jgi:uncharacterized protein